MGKLLRSLQSTFVSVVDSEKGSRQGYSFRNKASSGRGQTVTYKGIPVGCNQGRELALASDVVAVFNTNRKMSSESWATLETDKNTFAQTAAKKFNHQIGSEGTNKEIKFQKLDRARVGKVPSFCHDVEMHETFLVEARFSKMEQFLQSLSTPPSSSPFSHHEYIHAFSHHFFYYQNGSMAIDGLVGEYSDTTGYRLMVPLIHSTNRRFGIQDLGASGILHWMDNHKCNSLCAGLPTFYMWGKFLERRNHEMQGNEQQRDPIPQLEYAPDARVSSSSPGRRGRVKGSQLLID